MGVITVRQPSFAAGELAPTLWGRSDIKPYGAAWRRGLNFFVTEHGAAANRPGFRFAGATKYPDRATRGVEFNLSDAVMYVLEVGDLYIRVWRDGELVESSPGVPLEIVTTYAAAEVFDIVYSQVGDVVVFTCGGHAPAQLKHFSETSWTLSDIPFAPTDTIAYMPPLEPMLYPAWTQGPVDDYHPQKEWEWVATAIYSDGTESFPSTFFSQSGGSLCYSDRPMKIRISASTAVLGVLIYRGRRGIRGLVGEASQDSTGPGYWSFTDDGFEPDYTIQPPLATHPFRSPIWAAGTHYFPGDQVEHGGEIYECVQAGLSNASTPPTGHGSAIYDGYPLWTASTSYAYAAFAVNGQNLLMACMTVGGGTSGVTNPVFDPVSVFGLVSDGSLNWDILGASQYYWGGSAGRIVWRWVKTGTLPDRYPRAVTHYQQRRVFAGSDAHPDTVFLSAVGDLFTFAKPRLLNDSSPLEIAIATNRRESIRWMLPTNNLLLGTSCSEWVLGGTRGSPIGPSSMDARSYSERGSGSLPPLRVGNAVLYVQRKGTVVREIVPNDNQDSYAGTDRSLLSRHFFQGYEIVSWCYAEDPHSVVWAVRDDGKLLSFTYIHDHELWAWALHETEGTFQSVCAVVEGDEDVVYAVVRRSGGQYMERLASRTITAIEDAVFVDAAVTYDGAEATVITGLDHLEGQAVVGLADGNVVGPFTVSGGAVTLDNAARTVTLGLAYEANLETLDLALSQEELRTRVKTVRAVGLEVVESRGFEVAEDLDAADSLWNEWKQRDVIDLWSTIPLYTGLVKVDVTGRFGPTGRAAIRQVNPLPITVVGLTRELEVGGE